MINLIPEGAKKIVTKEYWTRTLSVWGFLVGLVAVALVFLLAPTYVLVQSQLSVYEKEIIDESGNEENFKTAEGEIRSANSIANQLFSQDQVFSVNQIIEGINNSAVAGVSIKSYRVERIESNIDSVHIQGVAGSRRELALFKDSLERSPLFETAIVPISDLARDNDLPFTIEVVTAPNIN